MSVGISPKIKKVSINPKTGKPTETLITNKETNEANVVATLLKVSEKEQSIVASIEPPGKMTMGSPTPSFLR